MRYYSGRPGGYHALGLYAYPSPNESFHSALSEINREYLKKCCLPHVFLLLEARNLEFLVLIYHTMGTILNLRKNSTQIVKGQIEESPQCSNLDQEMNRIFLPSISLVCLGKQRNRSEAYTAAGSTLHSQLYSSTLVYNLVSTNIKKQEPNK